MQGIVLFSSAPALSSPSTSELHDYLSRSNNDQKNYNSAEFLESFLFQLHNRLRERAPESSGDTKCDQWQPGAAAHDVNTVLRTGNYPVSFLENGKWTELISVLRLRDMTINVHCD